MARKIVGHDWLFIGISFFIIASCCFVFVWNNFSQQYYLDLQWLGFPFGAYFIAFILILYLLLIFFQPSLIGVNCVKAVLMLCLSLSVLELSYSAVLMTPFSTHDYFMHHADQLLGFHLMPMLQIMHQNEVIKNVIWTSYYGIFLFIHFFSVILAAIDKIEMMYHYYLSFLVSIFFGCAAAYFFPNMTSPAAIYPHYFFTPFQLNTLHQFQLEHQHKILHWNLVGGAESFPSFHAIWACFAIYFIAQLDRRLLPVALIFGVVIMVAAVATGWHYFFDIVGGAVVAMLSIQLAKFMLDQTEMQ